MTVCPFANQSKRYDRKYPGGYVAGFGYRGILHTTETTGLPSYQSGAVAPHFTVDPRTGRIWQHYDISRPARALQHLPGTIDTNNARAIQIEIIAYSDAAIAKKVGGLRVDQLTDAQLAPIRKLMRWIEAGTAMASKSTVRFESYPDSAGTSNGVRLSDSRWRAYAGWAGHSHVPHNNHGDPSDIAIQALLAQVTPPPAAVFPEVDMITIYRLNDSSERWAVTSGGYRYWIGPGTRPLVLIKNLMENRWGMKDVTEYPISQEDLDLWPILPGSRTPEVSE